MNRLYSGWSTFVSGDPNNNQIGISRSANFGLTWAAPVHVSSGVNAGAFNQGVNIQTAPNGDVYAVWAIYDTWINETGSPESAIGFSKSTDGGVSWTTASRIIDNIEGIRNCSNCRYEPYGIRVNSFPSMAVSQLTGHIYVVWTNKGFPGINGGDPDIYLIKSTDSGTTWSSTPVQVSPLDNGENQLFPWVSADPVYDHLAVVFLDGSGYPLTSRTVVTKTFLSLDDGTTFQQIDESLPFELRPHTQNYFWADYIGIASGGAKTCAVWNDDRTGVSQAWALPTSYTATVTVDQIREDQTRLTGTTLGHWQTDSFDDLDPGESFPSYVGPLPPASEIMRGFQGLAYGPTEKYNRWNELTNVINHQGLLVQNSTELFTSKFKRTYANAIIQNNLIDAPGNPSGDSIQFRDPWFIDYNDPPYGLRNRGQTEAVFRTVSSPFNPNTNPSGAGSEYLGVFLNQPASGSNPHYRLNALAVPLSSFAWYFLGWEYNPIFADVSSPSTNETGVVFLQDNAVVSAKYKAHLGSSSTSVTATSGQRKVIRDLNGVYHMAYESGNETWYTKSSDGTNWSQEVLLSAGDPSYYNLSPSLTVQDNPHLVIVVWEAYLPDNSGHDVVARSIDPVTGALGGFESVSLSSTGVLDFSMMPVVGAGISASSQRYVLCAWYDGYDSKLKGAVRNTSGGWTSPAAIRSGVISQMTLTPFSPSSTYQKWGLAWTENGTLYYMGIPINSSITLGTVETVAAGTANVTNLNPSVAHGVLPFSAPAIAWEEWKPELNKRVIKYRERHKSNGWSSTITTWQKVPGPSDYQTPTLSPNHQSQYNDVALVWRTGTSQLVYVKRELGVWGSVPNLATGLDPSISVGWTNPLRERVVHRGMSGPPYPVQRSMITFNQQLRLAGFSSPNEQVEGRGGKLYFTSGSAELVVLQALLNGERLSFGILPDTVKVRKLVDYLGFVRTIEFVGSGDLFLELQYTGTGNLPSDFSSAVVLRDALTGELLSTLQSFSNTGDTVVSLTVPLTWGTRLVRLGLEPLGRIPLVREFELGRWLQVSEDSLMFLKPEIAGGNFLSASSAVPREYFLHPAYPNPFNPATIIRYDLPIDGDVSLNVYDILGKQVASLIDRVETAGYHEVFFNASNLSSGIYFYRLTAGKFADVKKLIVLK